MASSSALPDSVVRFGDFEFNVRSGELRKAGMRLALPDQSRHVLQTLLETPGELVTREQLRARLWAADTFVDFEQGLNAAVRRLRDALGDSADQPRYVETLPRRGYRFVAPVHKSGGGKSPGQTTSPPRRRSGWLIPAAALVTTGLAGAYFWSDQPPSTPSTWLLASVSPADQLLSAHDVDRSPRLGFGRPSRTAVALSPVDRLLVFSGQAGGEQRLYRRPLDRAEAEPIPGTEGGDSPFFSPDGRWIGFWADGQIRKVAVAGGPVVAICEAMPLFGVHWGADDRIVFAQRVGGLWQVAARGGPPSGLTSLGEHELSHRLPHVLPGGDAVLFTVRRFFSQWQDSTIEVYVRSTGERRRLIDSGADARYVPSGHVVFARAGALFAAPFDLRRLVVTGDPVGVLEDVMQAISAGTPVIDTGAAQFSLDSAGTLVYVPGGIHPTAADALMWVDTSGRTEPLDAPPRRYTAPRLSPDGRRIAVSIASASLGFDIWTYDLDRGTLAPLTFTGSSIFPVWTPDGSRVTFSSIVEGRRDIFWVAADGSTRPERLISSDHEQDPADWSPDGRTLVFVERHPETKGDIRALSLDTNSDTPILASAFDEIEPALSPDGRWLAYASDESGRHEVYVRPFPGPGPRYAVSTDGGREPAWSRDGGTLYYTGTVVAPGEPLLAASITPGATFSAGRSRRLFDVWPYLTANRIRGYDTSADGRLLMVKGAEVTPTPVTHIRVVLNWFDEVKQRIRNER